MSVNRYEVKGPQDAASMDAIAIRALESDVRLPVRSRPPGASGMDIGYEKRKLERVIQVLRAKELALELKARHFGWWPCKNTKLWARTIAALGKTRTQLIHEEKLLREYNRG